MERYQISCVFLYTQTDRKTFNIADTPPICTHNYVLYVSSDKFPRPFLDRSVTQFIYCQTVYTTTTKPIKHKCTYVTSKIGHWCWITYTIMHIMMYACNTCTDICADIIVATLHVTFPLLVSGASTTIYI
jgi:hypothetical protein